MAAARVEAQQPSESEILESRRRLEQIRRERGDLRQEMTRMRTRAHDISSELQNLRLQAGSSAQLLEELEFQVGERGEQINKNARDLLVTRDQLGDRRAVLHRRLRDIYKRGALRPVQVLLTAESFGDLINRYRYLFLIARHDRLLVREVSALEMELSTRERLLERTLSELQDIQTERSIEHGELARMQSQQQRVLSGLTSRERAAARRLAQLERDERGLRSMLAGLERARTTRATSTAERRGDAASGAPSSLTTRDLGTLAWPVQGNLLYSFGRVAQPNGTAIRRNGVGIGAAAGSHVRAVEGGSVVMAGPFEGYGPTVVLSHGGGYYSLYLYLRDISVREGDRVARDQALGTVGGAATPEGSHIEFQIRAPGGEAIDPLVWLQKRSGG